MKLLTRSSDNHRKSGRERQINHRYLAIPGDGPHLRKVTFVSLSSLSLPPRSDRIGRVETSTGTALVDEDVQDLVGSLGLR